MKATFLFPIFLGALLLFASTGCTAAAQFHSKTGREFAPVARQAVVCREDDVPALLSAGGVAIGSVSAQGVAYNATNDDVTDKAARVAAGSGGTHVLLTDQKEERYTRHYAGEKTTTCQSGPNATQCRETYSPPTQVTYTTPTERFVVFRVEPEKWASLAEGLRPVPPK